MINSAIHQAAGLFVTSRNALQEAFLPAAPIHSQCHCTRNGASQRYGTAGSREAGGFVNSAGKVRNCYGN